MTLAKILKIPYFVVRDFAKFFIIYMPGGLGCKLRSIYYRRILKKCGSNVTIDTGVIIDGAEHITIGDDVYIDKYCVINTGKKLLGKIKRQENKDFIHSEGELVIGSHVHIVQFCIIMAHGGVAIGDYCTLSAGTKIYSLSNMPYDPEDRGRVVSIMPYNQAPFILSPVVLKDNVWAGVNSLIMPGSHIEKNSFVVSNSLVMGEFPENSYIAGQPATRVRARYSNQKQIQPEA